MFGLVLVFLGIFHSTVHSQVNINVITAQNIHKNIDERILPCTNFWAHACGNWSSSYVDNFDIVEDNYAKSTAPVLAAGYLKLDIRAPHLMYQMSVYFNACTGRGTWPRLGSIVFSNTIPITKEEQEADEKQLDDAIATNQTEDKTEDNEVNTEGEAPRKILSKRAGKPSLTDVEQDLKKKKLEQSKTKYVANVFEKPIKVPKKAKEPKETTTNGKQSKIASKPDSVSKKYEQHTKTSLKTIEKLATAKRVDLDEVPLLQGKPIKKQSNIKQKSKQFGQLKKSQGAGGKKQKLKK